MFPKKINPSFISLLFIALIVRLISQAGKPFWFDEAISWSFAKQNISQMFLATAADNHPPFYYLFLHFWLKIGSSEFFLRVPSVLFGLVSVLVFYNIGTLLFNRKVALTSSLIFSLSPLQVYFSTETRMYSLWTTLTLINFYYFLKIIKKPERNYYFLFAISYLLSLYTHYFSLVYILSLDLFLILYFNKYKRQIPGLLTTQAVALIFFLPWAIFILKNPHPNPWKIPLFENIPATYLSFVLGGLGMVTLKNFFAPVTPFIIKMALGITSLYFFILNIMGILKKITREIKLLLLLLVFFPVLLMSFVSLFKPVYSPRGFIVFSPAFYLLVSLGLENIAMPLRKWLKFMAVFLLGTILLIQNFYPPFKPQTLKEAADFIKKGSSSSITVHTDILTFYPFQYYFREDEANQFLIFPSGLTSKTTDIIGGSPVSLQKITAAGQPFWSVTYTWDEKTWRFKTKDPKLKDKFNYTLARTINDLEVFYYHPRQSTSSPLPR